MIDVNEKLPEAGAVLVFCGEIFDFDIGIYADEK